jgi:hypothetical protein
MYLPNQIQRIDHPTARDRRETDAALGRMAAGWTRLFTRGRRQSCRGSSADERCARCSAGI